MAETGGTNGGSNPTKPSYKIPGPVISENGGNVSISLPVQTTSKETKENKIYYKILGQGGYKEYTGTFKVETTCTIASYYITDKGERSETTYKDVYIAEPGMPKVTIQLKPSEYEVKYNAGKVEVTIKAQDSEKIEYSFNKVEWKEYTKPIEVTKNCRIYARGTNSNGETIEYKDITNLGAEPEIPDTLSVNITTKDMQGETGKVEKVKVSIGYDGRAERKYYKIGQTGEIKEYTGAFEVDRNCTIYAYAISEKGYGEAQKGIDSIEKGIMDPIITIKPNENYQASKVKVEIQYDKNATQKKYRINKGQYKDYTESFEVEENCEIEAYSTNAKGEIGKSKYRITNIIKEDVITVIDLGDYYIIRLTYPPTAINKEYKWQEDGTWKPYHDTGILLAKEKIREQVEGADVVKVKDEGGKDITFDKEDIYFITKPVNELIEQIYMRWDNRTPTLPEIILSTEEPCLELDATIQYSNTIIEKKYRIVYPNGVITSWKDYKDGEKIHVTQKGTTIYAKGQDETGMWTKTASRQINNIDEEPPVIKVEGDFETETTQLGLKIGVTDDVGIGKIKWSEGNQLESYFEENGEVLYEKAGTIEKNVQQEIKVKANGYYTIYAEDVAGNKGTYVLNIQNVEEIILKVTASLAPDYTSTKIRIEIESKHEIEEVTIDGEKQQLPPKGADGKYILTKNVTEVREYTIKAIDILGNVRIQKIIVNDDMTKDFDIYTLEDMIAFRDMVNSGRTFEGKTVTLMNDIDLQGNENNQWIPIGIGMDKMKSFNGTFNGKYHKISGLYINSSASYRGIFGTNYGNINELILEEGVIINGGVETGGIVGLNKGTIERCGNKINITSSNSDLGGIAGNNHGEIYYCYNKGNINRIGSYFYNVGGISGSNNGYLGKGIIENCYNTGEIKGDNSQIGGIVGPSFDNSLKHNNVVRNCYNIGKITGKTRTGSIVGTNGGDRTYRGGTVENCYYLQGSCANGIGYSYDSIKNEAFVKTSEEMKQIHLLLNSEFVEDTNNINNGYPIFKWELENENR